MNRSTACMAAMLAITLLAAAPTADALSYVMLSDESLLEQSDGVAKVTVIEAMPSKEGDRDTLYRVSVDAVLAGAALGQQRLLSLPGTFDAPKANWVVPGVPRLQAGSSYLVFHSIRADGMLQAQQLTLGLFALVPTTDGGAYVRFLDGDGDMEKAGENRRYHGPRDARSFEKWILDQHRGPAASANYFLDADDVVQSKFTFSSFNFSQPGPPPGPGRWFQFDSSQTLVWTARPDGQANTTHNEFQSLQNALAAWTNDAGSRILLSYSGTLADTPVCTNSSQPTCFSGHVKWNDPDNAIAGSFDCGSGGILGIGGSSAFSNSQTFNGQTWYPRARAVVTIQDNAGCFMDGNNGKNGEEILGHEIGHTLAFGHSCGDGNSPACASDATFNAALMRAVAHGDGRGASLAADDRAGAAIAYPEPNPPSANLSLQLSANESVATPGQNLIYTITVANAGPNEATSLQLTTTLPSGVTLNSASGSGWTCSGGTANCSRAALASAGSAPVTVSINVPMNYAGAAQLTLQSSISSGLPDPQTGNNSATLQTPVDFLGPFRIFGGPQEGGFEAL